MFGLVEVVPPFCIVLAGIESLGSNISHLVNSTVTVSFADNIHSDLEDGYALHDFTCPSLILYLVDCCEQQNVLNVLWVLCFYEWSQF